MYCPRTIRFGILQLLLILTTAFAFCSCESEDSIPPYYDTTKATATCGELRPLIANSEWDLLAAVQSEAGNDVSVDLAMDGDWVEGHRDRYVGSLFVANQWYLSL